MAALMAVHLLRPTLAAQETQPVELTAIGGVDNLRHFNKQAFGTLRGQFAANYHGLHPFVQAGLAHAGSAYVGTGILYDCEFVRHVWLTIGTGPGVYRHKGNDPDLGCAVEFASWVELSTIVLHHRVGLGCSHLSNAHLGSRNPGTETLGLVVHLRNW